MTATISDLFVYPLKGARGIEADSLPVNPQIGIVGDRRRAIRRVGQSSTEWASKTNFHVCKNTPLMATEIPRYKDAKKHNGNGRSAPYDRGLHPDYARELALRLGLEDLDVQDTHDIYSLADTKGGFVSFLNLETVAALDRFYQRRVDPRRFRANVWITGLPAFAELDWVDTYPGTRRFVANGVVYQIHDAIERCKAIEADPETGKFDTELLIVIGEMMKERGYRSPQRGVTNVMGILAAPIVEGTLRVGAQIQPLKK